MSVIPKDTRVLITGATGFTGANLLRKLVAMGLRVTAIARSSSRREHLADLPVVWVEGNVYDPAVVREAVKGVEYIFHVAAAFREAKIADEEYFRVHVESTRLLLDAALAEPGFKRFIHTSTIGVHGHIEHPPADETAPFAPEDMYQKTKLEGELLVREYIEKKNMPAVIIRPAGIYGPGDRRFLKVFKMVARGWVPLVGDHDVLLHLIHVDDLTDFHVYAAIHPRALAETFICGNPAATSLREMTAIIAEEYGRRIRYINIPRGALFFLSDICEALCKKIRVEPPLYRRRAAFFTKDRSFNTSKMSRVLGFQTAISLEQGIKSTARWYCEQGWVRIKGQKKDEKQN